MKMSQDNTAKCGNCGCTKIIIIKKGQRERHELFMVEIKEKYDLMLYNTAISIQLIMKYTALVLIR